MPKRSSSLVTGIRQWQITITETATPGRHLLTLQWRRFPCRATEWDGDLYNQIVDDLPRIESVDDLEAVLAAAVDGEWWESVRSTYPPPARP